jgi:hypothetical protein
MKNKYNDSWTDRVIFVILIKELLVIRDGTRAQQIEREREVGEREKENRNRHSTVRKEEGVIESDFSMSDRRICPCKRSD